MNGFLHFRFPHMPTNALGTFLLLVTLPMLSSIAAWGQGTEIFKCPESTYTFTGTPEQTLCEQYPNFNCETQIGAGTQFPKSSLIGASLSGNVCVVGDFEVDEPFVFQNAVVKINPGVTIAIAGSPNLYDGGASLGIDNSKLFACNGLWKGITLGFLSGISTYNNTRIEDAEKAISTFALCALSIQQTTFNRNRIGIGLFTQYPSIWVPGPLVWVFANNRFTCDAPLNGTTDEITYAGVKLKDSYLYTFQPGANTFSDIQYGIYSEGSASYIGTQNLIFQRIRRDGIFMDKGNINLRASQFLNGYDKGIHIESANNVTISGNCYFRWDDNLPLLISGLNLYYGVHVEGYAVASNTQISGNLFSADLTSGQKRVIGVWHQGSDIGGGAAIGMAQNTLHFYGGPAIGILLGGDFPSESQIDIYNNDFDIQDQLNAGSPTCIWSSGNKYDFGIIGNRFYNGLPKFGWATGMILEGSEGTENQVSDNHFEPGLYLQSYLCGIQVSNFKNTKFCANTSLNANRMFCFGGQNNGTDLTGNIAYGSQLLTLFDQSWIEDQIQKGNQWTAEYQGFIFPFVITPQAECMNPDFAEISEFRVHTPQSTALTGPGFNPFHPRDLFPDNNIEWWFQESGTPAGACIDEIVGPGNGDTKLKRAVADGTLAAQFSNPSMNWQAEHALYFALKLNPSLESLYPAYSTFKSAKEGGNIDKLYQVAVALNAARNGDATLRNDATNNRISIDDMLVQIEAADQAWQNAATPAEQEAAKAAKQQKMAELMVLLQNVANFQATYKQNLQSALAGVQQTNNSISNANEWEGYEKTVNSIFIGYLQNGALAEGEQGNLETIAELCPKIGGMAVYRARSILPECARLVDDNRADCYPAPEPLTPVEPRSTEYSSLKNVERAQVVPNPAFEMATVIVPNGKQGSVRLLSALGSLVSEQQIVSPQTSVGVAMLPQGIYYLEILYSDGQRECLKFVVSK
ncbi:MAG: T9SS type A sorting domain-containing protein [Saprospiraceae bacterium]|nr:T9SS type A sorting domain-containing protein [Saprospiraceae bacterium]